MNHGDEEAPLLGTGERATSVPRRRTPPLVTSRLTTRTSQTLPVARTDQGARQKDK